MHRRNYINETENKTVFEGGKKSEKKSRIVQISHGGPKSHRNILKDHFRTRVQEISGFSHLMNTQKMKHFLILTECLNPNATSKIETI